MNTDWLSVGLGCGISFVLVLLLTIWAMCRAASNADSHNGIWSDFTPEAPSKSPVVSPPPPPPEPDQSLLRGQCPITYKKPDSHSKITGK